MKRTEKKESLTKKNRVQKLKIIASGMIRNLKRKRKCSSNMQ